MSTLENMEVISTYTRQEAIEDGILADISHTSEAKEAGFKIPICATQALWQKIKDEVPEGQDWHGRLWDVCFMASFRVRTALKTNEDSSLLEFKVRFAEDCKDSILWITFNKYEGFTILFPEDY